MQGISKSHFFQKITGQRYKSHKLLSARKSLRNSYILLIKTPAKSAVSDCWQPCLVDLTAVLLVSLFLSLRCRVRVHPSSALPCSPLLVSLLPLTLSHTITKHILRGASTHCKPSALSRCNDDDGRIDRMEVEKAPTSLVVVVDRLRKNFILMVAIVAAWRHACRQATCTVRMIMGPQLGGWMDMEFGIRRAIKEG